MMVWICPICQKAVDPRVDYAWRRVWAYVNRPSEIVEYTHVGRCTELVKESYKTGKLPPQAEVDELRK